MNLAEAVFEYVFTEMFRLQQMIILGCFRPLQDWHAEIVFTQLAQGYTKGVRGFSHYAAGFSNNSAWLRTLLLKGLEGLAKRAMERRKQARGAREKVEKNLESKIEGLRGFVGIVDALTESTDAEIGSMKENLGNRRG